eukprot:gene38697-52277_t
MVQGADMAPVDLVGVGLEMVVAQGLQALQHALPANLLGHPVFQIRLGGFPQVQVGVELAAQAFDVEQGFLQQHELGRTDAREETPTAAVQYRLTLDGGEERALRFIFGPAFDDAEIRAMRGKYLSQAGFAEAKRDYAWYIEQGRGVLQIETPDAELDNFVNHWLPRPVYYHGDVNRLTTDPQTRNYLQDNMGMSFIKPQVTRAAFLHALSQQEANGA